MKINFQSVNFNADSKLVSFAIKKSDKIKRFYNKVVDVFILTRIENSSNGTNKFAELIVGIPGKNIVVKKRARTFEEAIHAAINSVERIIKKKKQKINSHS